MFGKQWLWLFLALFLLNSAPVQADTPLASWREELVRVRQLAENDIPQSYEQAKQLQTDIPALATVSDRVQLLNLLARIELYGARTEQASQHVYEALTLSSEAGDKIGQAESALNQVFVAVHTADIDEMIAAGELAMSALEDIHRVDLQSEAILRTAMLYQRLGRVEDSFELALKGMELAKEAANPLSLMYAHHGLALAYAQNGQPNVALEHYQQMVTQAQAANSSIWEAFALFGVGALSINLGDAVAGEAFLQKGVELCRRIGAPFCVAQGLFHQVTHLRAEGHYAEALTLLNEIVAIYERYPNVIALWWTLDARSASLQALGELEAARQDVERGYKLALDIGLPQYAINSTRRRAALAAARGDYQRAYEYRIDAAEKEAQAEEVNSSERVMKLAERYETESKQRRIRELTRQSERDTAQRRLLVVILSATTTLLVGGGWFLWQLRHSHRLLQTSYNRLQRMQNYQQAILDALPDFLFELGADGRYYGFHSLSAGMLPGPPEKLIGKTVFDTLPPDAAEVCMAALKEAEDKGTSFGKQIQLTLASKQTWFEMSVARKQGDIPRYIVLSRDITRLKEIERSLTESYVELRELAASEESAREQERQRISRELHDELGQMLTAIRLETSMLKLQFSPGDQQFQSKVAHIVSLVDHTIGEVRNVVNLLRPVALERGIVDALEWMADDFESYSGIHCELSIGEGQINKMEGAYAIALFRIAQASLTNVVRHSGADTVQIGLEQVGGDYCLTISDNGRGFDTAMQKEKSTGLLGIRERVSRLNGRLTMDSAPGRGVRLKVCLPVPESSYDDTKINE